MPKKTSDSPRHPHQASPVSANPGGGDPGSRGLDSPAPQPSASSSEASGNEIFQRALDILRADPPPASPGIPAVPSSTPASTPPPPPSPPQQPIPARMLNEFVYCPRLFYYEYVEGVFAENAHTVRGSSIHKRVDAGSGSLAPAAAQASPGSTAGSATDEPSASESSAAGTEPTAAPPEQIHSRSVSLGSEKLGVVAKLDLVEGWGSADGGSQADLFSAKVVIPVDYKAGKPREGRDANELWPADQMQLGLQILLLRENGYACNEGVIYYRATRQRVRFQLTAEREAWVRSQILHARETMSGPIPPPLVNSPKCKGCSLAPICLPDETRLLARLNAPPPEPEIVTKRRVRSPGLQTDGITDSLTEPGTAQADSPASTRPDSGTSETKPKPEAPRRLMAARDDKRALYLNTPGLRVGRKDEVLTIKDKDTLLDEVRMNDVSHVALFGNIQITTQAIQDLCDAEIPVTYFSGGGWFYGITHGHGLKNVFLRIEQFRLARDPAFALRIARAFVHGKIRNHRTLLMRNHVEAPASALLRLKQAAQDALAASALDELLGIEGAAAAVYFEQFSGMLKLPDPTDDDIPGLESTPPPPGRKPFTFDFTARHRRPPTDPVNALLSLAYSMLSKDCTIAAAAVGFDPYVGFYHQPRFGRPAMALDLMEEFRPLVAESAVLSAINNRMVQLDDFVSAGDAVNLTPAGRKKFFLAYEQRMSSLLTHPLFDYKVSYRRALELQARILARVLTGEIPDYIPLTTR
jgi:CRISP-associated protein Cas1